jgi:DNA-binding transcriptional ArsR family regulator
MSSKAVRDQFETILERAAESDGDQEIPLAVLMTPRARFEALWTVLTSSEPLTVSEVVDQTDRDQSTINRHLRDLADLGYLEQGKKGNAAVFSPRADHPVIQLLEMLLTVQHHGVTPLHLEETFIGTPGDDYESGDHPNDPGGWTI